MDIPEEVVQAAIAADVNCPTNSVEAGRLAAFQLIAKWARNEERERVMEIIKGYTGYSIVNPEPDATLGCILRDIESGLTDD